MEQSLEIFACIVFGFNLDGQNNLGISDLPTLIADILLQLLQPLIRFVLKFHKPT